MAQMRPDTEVGGRVPWNGEASVAHQVVIFLTSCGFIDVLMTDLDELTFSSFEPKPTVPAVVPVNSRFEVLCRLPRGLPQPILRYQPPEVQYGLLLFLTSIMPVKFSCF